MVKALLNKLKNKFGKLFSENKEEKRKETVKAEALEEWFGQASKELIENINKEMRNICLDIKGILEDTKEKTDLLNDAKLRNENIHPRAKQILAGNKDEYIKKIKQFIGNASPPEDINKESISAYCENIKRSMDFLKKNSIKQSLVLREFHEHEAYEVIKCIKAIEDKIENLQKILDSEDMNNIEKLRAEIEELSRTIKSKKRISEEIGLQQNDLETSKKSLDKIKKELSDTIKNKEFKEVEQLDEQKDNISQNAKKIETILQDKFANMRKALEKFKRGKPKEKLIDAYLENPLEALKKDIKLEIIPEINALEKSIANNQIDLKENIKAKTIRVCKQTTKEELEELLSEHSKLIKERELIDEKINNSTITKIKSDLESNEKFLTERIRKNEETLNNLKTEFIKIKIDNMARDIEKSAEESLGIALSIKSQ
ncbi:MAG: hypothetical protein Q8O89_06915 [Nanoarchaeota archaeon]|nr:hypothetical protein [Nanoarchaeota archaeon]